MGNRLPTAFQPKVSLFVVKAQPPQHIFRKNKEIAPGLPEPALPQERLVPF